MSEKKGNRAIKRKSTTSLLNVHTTKTHSKTSHNLNKAQATQMGWEETAVQCNPNMQRVVHTGL